MRRRRKAGGTGFICQSLSIYPEAAKVPPRPNGSSVGSISGCPDKLDSDNTMFVQSGFQRSWFSYTVCCEHRVVEKSCVHDQFCKELVSCSGLPNPSERSSPQTCCQPGSPRGRQMEVQRTSEPGCKESAPHSKPLIATTLAHILGH